MNVWKYLWVVVIAMVVAGARPRPAAADPGDSNDERITIAVLGGVAYVGTTAAFAVHDVAARDPGEGYGVAEALVNAPLAAAWMYYGLRTSRSRPDGSPQLVLLGVLNGALTAHGVYTIVRHEVRKRRSRRHQPEAPEPPAPPPDGLRIVLTPVAVDDGVQLGAGLGLAGSF